MPASLTSSLQVPYRTIPYKSGVEDCTFHDLFWNESFVKRFISTSVGDPGPEPDPHVLDLPDPDPDSLVRGTDTNPDPAPAPSLFTWRCWADWNNACKTKFYHKILAKNYIFKTEDTQLVDKI
jgi:hypothetical protein